MRPRTALVPAADVASPTDAALLEAIACDDLSALGALYDRYAASVWRVVRRVTGRADDVDDIVHATFLKVPRLAAAFDGRASARSWLIGIAVRTALRQMRTAYRLRSMIARLAHISRSADRLDPERVATGRAEMATLERAVSALSPTKRAVFLLVEVEGLSHAEVASALEVPIATIRTRLFHAKDDLRHALGMTEAR